MRRRRRDTARARMLATIPVHLTPRQAMAVERFVLRAAADEGNRVHDRIRCSSALGSLRQALYADGWEMRMDGTWEREPRRGLFDGE